MAEMWFAFFPCIFRNVHFLFETMSQEDFGALAHTVLQSSCSKVNDLVCLKICVV